MDNIYLDKILNELGKKSSIDSITNQNDNVCKPLNSNYKITEDDICQCKQKKYIEPLYDKSYKPISNKGLDHICSIEGNCYISNMFKDIYASIANENLQYKNKYLTSSENFPYPELYDKTLDIEASFGGASVKSVKRKISNFQQSKNSIEEYGNLILKELGNSFGIIGNKITEDDILSILTKIYQKKEKQINLSQNDIYFLLNYVRENYNKLILEKFYTHHSLVSIINLNDVDLQEQLFQLKIFEDSINYNRLVEFSRLISDQFDDISSMGGPYPKLLHMSTKNTMIDPLFVALFLVKLPGLEELFITEDYYGLINDIKQKRTSKNNIMLLLLRLADPSHLNLIGSSHKNSISTEVMRIVITQALRKIIIDMRSGKFYSDINKKLIDLLNKIITPNAKTEDESLLHALLETVSFKPTLIKTSNLLYLDDLPTAVHSVNYDITNAPYSNNISPIINTQALDTMIFNPQTGRISMYPYEKVNNKLDDSVIKRILKVFSTAQETININSITGPFVTPKGIDFSDKQNIKTEVLMSNGVFFVSIPRLTRKSFDPLMQYTITDKLNTQPIEIEKTIHIRNNIFELRSAVCYLTQDDSSLFGLKLCSHSKPIGKIALIKTKKGWFKYNPYFGLYPREEKEQYLRSFKYLFRTTIDPDEEFEMDDDEFESRYLAWMKDEKNRTLIELKTSQISEGKFRVEDFLIGNEEAEYYLKHYSTLLVYSENYETYYKNNSTNCSCC